MPALIDSKSSQVQSSLINFPLLLPNNKLQEVQSKISVCCFLCLDLFINSFLKFGFFSEENRQEAFKNLKFKEIQQLMPI